EAVALAGGAVFAGADCGPSSTADGIAPLCVRATLTAFSRPLAETFTSCTLPGAPTISTAPPSTWARAPSTSTAASLGATVTRARTTAGDGGGDGLPVTVVAAVLAGSAAVATWGG